MINRLDPLSTSELISETYRRYLRSLLPVRDPALASALDSEIAQSPLLTKGPLLEATPPYASGATLAELVDEGVFDPALRALDSPGLPFDRPLYRHQEQAVRKAAAGRNLVVATGTGSGKTEGFLLPILNALAAEHARGELGPGVRALLLYPMNALANDQMKRLRQILAPAPHITFGRYIGDTKEQSKVAKEVFEQLNPGEPRLPNELLSREEMRERPPHLLLTNYAMLEYLLLRPADLDLFEGPYGGHWRFIVVDEAHVYDGARAAELAMLLRRLRDRVAPDRMLQCMATSATVGDSYPRIADFAERLFDAPFAWDPTDPARQDVVAATTEPMPKGPFWGPLDPPQYQALLDTGDPAADVLELAAGQGVSFPDGALALAHERRTAELRRALADGPRMFADLASEIFDDVENPMSALATLVAVGSRVVGSGGSPVLSARYHLFARATEGAFACQSDSGPHVSLGRREICPDCSAAVFEFGACKRCGAVHLLGSVRTVDGGYAFGPQRSEEERRVWLLLGDAPIVIDEDDETLEGDEAGPGSEDAFLCPSCGALHGRAVGACGRGGCAETRLWPVRRLNKGRDTISGCLACGARGADMVRRFESGSEAAVSVLSTALYQALPPAQDEEVADRPGDGRKLLLFSDSRQSAAFFASYLESSYGAVQRRRLVLDGLQRATRDDDRVQVDDVAHHVVKAGAAANVFQRRSSAQERRRLAALWVMLELVATDDRQSLEGRGLLRVDLDRPSGWRIPPALTALGLDEQSAWALLCELARSLRQQGALTMPEDVDPRDEAFDPRRGPIYVRETGAERRRKVLSWLPTQGVNRRLDFVTRVLKRLDSGADAKEVLRGCWRAIESQADGWLHTENQRGLGVVRQVDHTWLLLSPVTSDVKTYCCTVCRRLAPASVLGVCPTLGCEGILEPYQVPEADDEDHYRVLYRTGTPVPLAAREHTAQWTSAKAAEIQQQFLRGEVNALSCSTTFELGVDVGELQSVVLRNVPPTTANYVQRAGRAGRRSDSAALVVTYAQRRSHDLSRYQDPTAMVTGEVRAPYVPLDNARIDRRHAHSVALAAFFRYAKQTAGEVWTTAGQFFLGDDGKPAPCTRVRGFLRPVPEEVEQSLHRVLPKPVQREIGIDDGSWVETLADLLEEVREQLAHDVHSFEERRQQAFEERKGYLVQRYERTINTLEKRELLGFLANRNVLPKYGFPVDTVELRTGYADQSIGAQLELSRDLSSAIYEYAPGAEIVAGGHLWTSGGVYRLPDRELITKHYAVCQACGHYRESDTALEPVCPSCGTQAQGVPRQYFVPEFGFVAQRQTRRPSVVLPRRSWNGATYLVSRSPEAEEYEWPLANGGTATAEAGARGRLVAISEGPGRSGYRICDWCGWGTPGAAGRTPHTHSHLLRDIECTGPLQVRSLAHPYETDILEITFDHLSTPPHSDGLWRSTLYALLEGAADGLEISRDDIDGTSNPRPGGETALVVFDTVPGGAGNALRIGRSLDTVLAAALHRVERCDCGEETSCYGCLRNFRNQRFHEELTRGAALKVLRPLV